MKSLFYGGAVAAVSGLVLGAGMKAPVAVADFEPMAEVGGDFEAAELTGYDPAPQYVTQAAYTPVTEFRTLQSAEPAGELTPAVYTVEPDESAPAPIYELAAVEPDEAPTNIIRSTDALPEPPVTGHSQGFALVEEAPDPS